MENFSATELLLKCVTDLVSENVGKQLPLDLFEIVEQLEVMNPEFTRDQVQWDVWEDLLKDRFRTMRHSLLNRN